MKCILLITCMALIGFVKAGSDTKLLKQVSASISKRDFKKAEEALEKVSASAQTSLPYLQSAALVYDSLKEFSKAISFYNQLSKQTADSTAIETRVLFLKKELAAYEEAERIRLERMKNCTKCNGTGSLQQQVICPLCDGQRIVSKPCSRCQGTSRVNCSGCRGAGRIEISDNGRTTLVNCSGCGGKGYFLCNSCTRGSISEDCRKCNATGTIIISKTCDMH